MEFKKTKRVLIKMQNHSFVIIKQTKRFHILGTHIFGMATPKSAAIFFYIPHFSKCGAKEVTTEVYIIEVCQLQPWCCSQHIKVLERPFGVSHCRRKSLTSL